MTALGTTLVFEDQLRTAGYSDEAIKAAVEALTKSLPHRMLEVERRALALGCEVDRNKSSIGIGWWLSIDVRRDGRVVGSLAFWPAYTSPAGNEIEEKFTLTATCDALAGLPMQADWLLENARAVREIFTALVLP